jgi:hypothetical protein
MQSQGAELRRRRSGIKGIDEAVPRSMDMGVSRRQPSGAGRPFPGVGT